MYKEIADEYFNESEYLNYSIVVFRVETIVTIFSLVLYYYFQNIVILSTIFLLFIFHLFLFNNIYDAIFIEKDKKRMKKILKSCKVSLKKYREFCKSQNDFKFPIPIPWGLVSVLFVSYIYQFFTTPIPDTIGVDEFIEVNYQSINILIAAIFLICCALSGCLYAFEVIYKIHNKYFNLNKVVDEIYFE